MKVLFDTECWLWLHTRPERLGAAWLDRLQDPEATTFLSAASSWEIAIKYALGKLVLPAAPARYVPDRMDQTGTQALAVTHLHALRVADLPAHHKDPFDRLLVAQAQIEALPLLTSDRRLERYDVEIHWAG